VGYLDLELVGRVEIFELRLSVRLFGAYGALALRADVLEDFLAIFGIDTEFCAIIFPRPVGDPHQTPHSFVKTNFPELHIAINLTVSQKPDLVWAETRPPPSIKIEIPEHHLILDNQPIFSHQKILTMQCLCRPVPFPQRISHWLLS
jgi:hypothetical protein